MFTTLTVRTKMKKKLTASRIRKLKKKIKTWKIWWSRSMFGFHHYTDIMLYKLATSSEPSPDAVIYGLSLRDALERYVSKRPWVASSMRYSRVNSKTFAKIAALPNHGMHKTACPWNLNLPKHIEFWM